MIVVLARGEVHVRQALRQSPACFLCTLRLSRLHPAIDFLDGWGVRYYLIASHTYTWCHLTIRSLLALRLSMIDAADILVLTSAVIPLQIHKFAQFNKVNAINPNRKPSELATKLDILYIRVDDRRLFWIICKTVY